MIYFVQDSASCCIKIGFTSKENPEERKKDFQTGCPGKAVVLATCAGTRAGEKDLQRRFADAHSHGEWFKPVPALMQFIISKAAISLAAEYVAAAGTAIETQRAEREAHRTFQESFPRFLEKIHALGWVVNVKNIGHGELGPVLERASGHADLEGATQRWFYSHSELIADEFLHSGANDSHEYLSIIKPNEGEPPIAGQVG